MKEFVSVTVVFVGTLMALMFPRILPLARAQEVPQKQVSQQGDNISDKELGTFAKAYVEIQKIRLTYESSLGNVQEPEERQKIQQEGDSNIEKVLEKERLQPETYNSIFTVVNSNDELRKKVLKMIEEERGKE